MTKPPMLAESPTHADRRALADLYVKLHCALRAMRVCLQRLTTARPELAQSSRLMTTSPGAPASGTNSAAANSALVARVLGEYREMPGLRLTFAQACRLWQMDPGVCEVVLQSLVADHSLARTVDGVFIALPAPRARATPVKATPSVLAG